MPTMQEKNKCGSEIRTSILYNIHLLNWTEECNFTF